MSDDTYARMLKTMHSARVTQSIFIEPGDLHWLLGRIAELEAEVATLNLRHLDTLQSIAEQNEE